MTKRKFPFLKCCKWLYQSALSAGTLFVLYGFWQYDLLQVSAFSNPGLVLGLITAGTFIAQLLLVWAGEKDYLLHVGLGLLALNVAAGIICMRRPENRIAFWCYVGLEAACMISVAVVYIIRHFTVLKGLLVLAQAIALVALAILSESLPRACVGVMLVAFLLFLVELTDRKHREVLELLPFFALAMLAVCMIPKNEKPMDWTWAKDVYEAVKEKVQMQAVNMQYLFAGENDFSFSFAGYGDEGSVGGLLFDGEQEQLVVAGSGTKNPLYLTGTVYEEYTGEGWQNGTSAIEEADWQNGEDSLMEALENSIYADRAEKLTSTSVVSIEYRFIKTQDLFHELHTTEVFGNIPPRKQDAPWNLQKAQGKDFSYQIRFLESNEQSEEIKEIYRQQAWKEDAVWGEDAAYREEEIYETYTQLPEDISPRVYELAHTLAAGADNDYDRMMAFVNYLKDYTYTTTPPECPDGEDELTYFLFESKSGYCTYFATALAVLGRCEGIPTRYVKGFMTTDLCRNSYTKVTVTGEDAHAWTEVYIAHVGWVRMDATPGYGQTYADRWSERESDGIGPIDTTPAPIVTPPEETEVEPAAPGKPAQWYFLVLLKIIAALLAGIMLCVAIIWLRDAVRRRKYADADTGKKVRRQMKELLRLGKLQGVPLSEGETLQAYQERVHKILDTKEYAFAEACTLYEGMRFGEKEVSPKELQRLEDYTETAKRCYLAGCGFLRKLIYRIM